MPAIASSTCPPPAGAPGGAVLLVAELMVLLGLAELSVSVAAAAGVSVGAASSGAAFPGAADGAGAAGLGGELGGADGALVLEVQEQPVLPAEGTVA